MMDARIMLTLLLYIYSLGVSHGCDVDERVIVDSSSMGQRISSNGFPSSKYVAYSDECWTISNREYKTMKIWFHDFYTEYYFDIVRVYDGAAVNDSKLLAELSGAVFNTEQRMFVSSGPYLHVVFTSDSTTERQGWQACICFEFVSCNCSWSTLSNITETNLNDWMGSMGRTSVSVIGAVVGGIVLVCVVVGIAVGCYMSKRTRRRTAANNSHVTNNAVMTSVPPGTYPVQQGVGIYPAQQGVAAYPAQQGVAAYPAQQGVGPYPAQQGMGYYNQAQVGVTPGTYQGQQGVGYYNQPQYGYAAQQVGLTGEQQADVVDTRLQKEADTSAPGAPIAPSALHAAGAPSAPGAPPDYSTSM